MEITNDYRVARGRRVSTAKGDFKPGAKFPAKDLGIDEQSFSALIADNTIVEASAPEAKPGNDGLDDLRKSELVVIAERYGLDGVRSLTKDKIIAAIRKALK